MYLKDTYIDVGNVLMVQKQVKFSSGTMCNIGQSEIGARKPT